MNTTGMPERRSCSSASAGPTVASTRITVGSSASTPSADRSCPAGVTSGRCAAAGKVVAVSRPTTCSPSPSANTISAMLP